MNTRNLKFINILKIIRPYQWVKNILVFIPMLMAHQLTINNFILSIKAFIIFSLIASSIYVINDIVDVESDKKHPYKKYRPLAAGLINIDQCKILIFFLFVFKWTFFNLNKRKFFFINYFIFYYFKFIYFFFQEICLYRSFNSCNFIYFKNYIWWFNN